MEAQPPKEESKGKEVEDDDLDGLDYSLTEEEYNNNKKARASCWCPCILWSLLALAVILTGIGAIVYAVDTNKLAYYSKSNCTATAYTIKRAPCWRPLGAACWVTEYDILTGDSPIVYQYLDFAPIVDDGNASAAHDVAAAWKLAHTNVNCWINYQQLLIGGSTALYWIIVFSPAVTASNGLLMVAICGSLAFLLVALHIARCVYGWRRKRQSLNFSSMRPFVVDDERAALTKQS